jgi:hypothetical protein
LAGLTEKSIYLPFTDISPNYLPRYCLNNCEDVHRNLGYEIVYGWMLWELPAAEFIEAEFHAVVKDRKSLLDITQRADGENTILFVPDPTRVATRVDRRTWRTWTNFKAQHGIMRELSRQILMVDTDLP